MVALHWVKWQESGQCETQAQDQEENGNYWWGIVQCGPQTHGHWAGHVEVRFRITCQWHCGERWVDSYLSFTHPVNVWSVVQKLINCLCSPTLSYLSSSEVSQNLAAAVILSGFRFHSEHSLYSLSDVYQFPLPSRLLFGPYCFLCHPSSMP